MHRIDPFDGSGEKYFRKLMTILALVSPNSLGWWARGRNVGRYPTCAHCYADACLTNGHGGRKRMGKERRFFSRLLVLRLLFHSRNSLDVGTTKIDRNANDNMAFGSYLV